MEQAKFIRKLQIGEYITPPNTRGIDADIEEYAELTVDEDYLWCKRTRKLDVLAGRVEKFEDGVLTVVINPILVKLSGVAVAIGAEVTFRTDYDPITYTRHIDCPVCNTHAKTNIHGQSMEKQLAISGAFSFNCLACDTVYNVLVLSFDCYQYIKASVGTEVDKTTLQRRSTERLERLKDSNAPQALIDAEIEILEKRKGGESCGGSNTAM